MSFWTELKRRNVIRVGVAYVVMAWLLLQVGDTLFDLLDVGPTPGKALLGFLLLGFLPVLLFSWAYEITTEGIKRERDVERDESITHLTAKRLDLVTLAALLGVGGMVLWQHFQQQNAATELAQGDDRSHVQPAVDAGGSASTSIAVLPFTNLSSDPEQEFFSDGISEEILNALAQVKKIKVTGKWSSFAFKGKHEDLRRVGEVLGVEHVLLGSVRQVDGQVRVTAQLVSTKDGFQLWSQSFDRELEDIFAIQEEIAEQIRQRLVAGLGSGLEVAPTDPAAYSLYLEAKELLLSRSGTSIAAAAQLLQRALAIDPNYAPANAQLAIATLLQAADDTGGYGSIPLTEAVATAKPLVDKALVLDPNLAEGWFAKGYYHHRLDQYQTAIDLIEKALQINPNLLNARNQLGFIYDDLGQTDEALTAWREALAIDPLFPPALVNSIFAADLYGRPDDALAAFEHVKNFPGESWVLTLAEGMLQLALGDAVAAQAPLRIAVKLNPEAVPILLTFADALLRTQQLREIADLDAGWQRFLALDLLGRSDEALVGAEEFAASGNPKPLLRLLNRMGDHQEVIDRVVTEGHDLDQLEQQFPADSRSHEVLTQLALAYLKLDNKDRAMELVTRVSRTFDQRQESGIKHWRMHRNHARILALTEDHDAAIRALAIAVERGMQDPVPLAATWPSFEYLADDPRFLELERRVAEAVNSSRQELLLPPIEGPWLQ